MNEPQDIEEPVRENLTVQKLKEEIIATFEEEMKLRSG